MTRVSQPMEKSTFDRSRTNPVPIQRLRIDGLGEARPNNLVSTRPSRLFRLRHHDSTGVTRYHKPAEPALTIYRFRTWPPTRQKTVFGVSAVVRGTLSSFGRRSPSLNC